MSETIISVCSVRHYMPIDKMKTHPNNPRTITIERKNQLRESILSKGIYQPFLVWKRNGFTLAGNHRLEICRELIAEGYVFRNKKGEENVLPIVLEDCTDEQAQAILFETNNTYATWVEDKLREALEAAEPSQISDWGFTTEQVDQIVASAIKEAESIQADEVEVTKVAPCDDEDIPKVKAEPTAKPGDVYRLGKHRVMCGDATSITDIEKLMDGQKADLVITSPPYNSDNEGCRIFYHHKSKKDFYQNKTDARSEEEYIQFCSDVLNNISTILRNDACPVIWNVMYNANSRAAYGKVVFGSKHPFSVQETICWDKKAGFPTASKGILSRNWELIFVLCKQERYFTTQEPTEVRFNKWDISRYASGGHRAPAMEAGDIPRGEASHGAVFPVALAERALSDFSEAAHVVFEPFAGSGSTVIAAEKARRKCYAMEVDPFYVDTIVARWEKYTGEKAELIGHPEVKLKKKAKAL
jgi:DNA modification methylase